MTHVLCSFCKYTFYVSEGTVCIKPNCADTVLLNIFLMIWSSNICTVFKYLWPNKLCCFHTRNLHISAVVMIC